MGCRRFRWRVTLALHALLLGAAATCLGSTAPAQTEPTLVVRLFLDLQDPPSREAWQLYRKALAPFAARARLHIHHLPLARHAHARGAAVAAHVARGEGQEAAFVDALLRHPVPDGRAIAKAAGQVGLDRDRLTRIVAAGAASAEAAAVEQGRRAAIAFGVRAAPSALINGRGVAGVPPAAALAVALRRADADCRGALRGGAAAKNSTVQRDCEVDGATRYAPAELGALRILRSGGVSAASATHPAAAGRLAERFRVELEGGELTLGDGAAKATAVYFADLSDAVQRRSLGHLLGLQRRHALRLVVLPLPRYEPAGTAVGNGRSLRVALAVVALTSLLDPPERRRLMRALGDPRLADWRGLQAMAAALGVNAAALDKAAAAPATTVLLDRHIRRAAVVDARPGAIYLNGRRWTGQAWDPGIEGAIAEVVAEATTIGARGIPPRLIYPGLIAAGRRVSPAERDLQPAEPAAEFTGVPDLGSAAAGPALDVYLFVDFSGLASRAAFHTLERLRRHPEHPVRLHLLSLASMAQPGVTPSGASFLVAHHHGRGLAAARAIFALRDANRWSSLQRVLRKVGVSAKTLKSEANGPMALAGAALADRLRQRLEMAEEPVIYLGRRRYVGPLEEGRMVAAVALVAGRAAAARPPASKGAP